MDSEKVKDAKYYLIRPKDSYMVYLMKDKPDYLHEPFYEAAKEEECAEDYLDTNYEFIYDSDDISSEMNDALDAMNLLPNENEVKYLFESQQEFSDKDLPSLLSSFSYCADEIIAKHYEVHTWHIKELLEKSPFKEYIQAHYFSKPSIEIKPKEVPEELVQEREELLQNGINELNKKRLLL